MSCPWACPVCREPLTRHGTTLACTNRHSYDVAREGYVNLLRTRRSRQPGDNAEMVRARRRFLASGAYEPLTAAVAEAVSSSSARLVLDVGCGDGHHTRRLSVNLTAAIAGVDVSRPAVAAAAKSHRQGWYAVANGADLPLGDGQVETCVNIFGPVFPPELARVVRPGGRVIAVHPGPGHLAELRRLVYDASRPHDVKDPLRHASEWFTAAERMQVRFPVVVEDAEILWDLFVMTPYRWHGPPDIRDRLRVPFETSADVVVSIYVRE